MNNKIVYMGIVLLLIVMVLLIIMIGIKEDYHNKNLQSQKEVYVETGKLTSRLLRHLCVADMNNALRFQYVGNDGTLYDTQNRRLVNVSFVRINDSHFFRNCKIELAFKNGSNKTLIMNDKIYIPIDEQGKLEN